MNNSIIFQVDAVSKLWGDVKKEKMVQYRMKVEIAGQQIGRSATQVNTPLKESNYNPNQSMVSALQESQNVDRSGTV